MIKVSCCFKLQLRAFLTSLMTFNRLGFDPPKLSESACALWRAAFVSCRKLDADSINCGGHVTFVANTSPSSVN